MWINKKNILFDQIVARGKAGQIYIIPTIDALKLLFLNATLLIVGLVYANNYVLLFNFILFCLFLSSMYYTHFNLRGLKLISAKITPFHANEVGNIKLIFKSNSKLGHYSISFRNFRQAPITIDPDFNFSIEGNTSHYNITCPIHGHQRGVKHLDKIIVQTLFPFHLFRCLVFFTVNLKAITYPARLASQGANSRKLSLESEAIDDDFSIRNFALGDSLKHVHWKKLAQTNKWFTKTPNIPLSSPLVFIVNEEDLNIEPLLESITENLYHCHKNQVSFGLSLKNKIIPPDCSTPHLSRCLKALAEYEK